MKHICYPIIKKIIDKNTCSESWEYLERIGEEANYGEIYGTCCNKDCNYILKFMPYENDNIKEDILNEIEIQKECSVLGLCPNIEEAWLCEQGGAIIMENFDTTIANLLIAYKSDYIRNIILANLLSLIDKLHLYNIYHGDLHLNNIMVKINNKINAPGNHSEEELYNLKNYKYYLIDFGKSGKIKDDKLKRIYKDYDDILAHLIDLSDEYPDDEGFKNLVHVMQTHMKKFD